MSGMAPTWSAAVSTARNIQCNLTNGIRGSPDQALCTIANDKHFDTPPDLAGLLWPATCEGRLLKTGRVAQAASKSIDMF